MWDDGEGKRKITFPFPIAFPASCSVYASDGGDGIVPLSAGFDSFTQGYVYVGHKNSDLKLIGPVGFHWVALGW